MNKIERIIYLDVFGDFKLDTPEETDRNIKTVRAALTTDCLSTITSLHNEGPLDDSCVLKKIHRDWLCEHNYVSKVIVKGNRGYNACTPAGADLYKCLRSLYSRFDTHPTSPLRMTQPPTPTPRKTGLDPEPLPTPACEPVVWHSESKPHKVLR